MGSGLEVELYCCEQDFFGVAFKPIMVALVLGCPCLLFCEQLLKK